MDRKLARKSLKAITHELDPAKAVHDELVETNEQLEEIKDGLKQTFGQEDSNLAKILVAIEDITQGITLDTSDLVGKLDDLKKLDQTNKLLGDLVKELNTPWVVELRLK